MNRFPVHAVASAALLAAMAFATTPGLAASRCDNPNGRIEQRACAKAAESAQALRRFVERTRMIYALYYYDFAPEDRDTAAAAVQPSHVAELTKAP